MEASMSYIARTYLTNRQADRKLENKEDKVRCFSEDLVVSRVVLFLAWIFFSFLLVYKPHLTSSQPSQNASISFLTSNSWS